MLAKLAFVMQKIEKNIFFVMINKDRGTFLVYGGDTAVMRGHRAHGGPPQSPH